MQLIFILKTQGKQTGEYFYRLMTLEKSYHLKTDLKY